VSRAAVGPAKVVHSELNGPDRSNVSQISAGAPTLFRHDHAAAVLVPDGRALVVGGGVVTATGGYVAIANAEIYMP
jgi:hypothetical protein